MDEFKTDIVGVPTEGVMYVSDGVNYFTYDFGHHGVRYPSFNTTFMEMCKREKYIFGSLEFVKIATVERLIEVKRVLLEKSQRDMDDLNRHIITVNSLTPEIVDRMEREHNSAQFN